jgi:Domain of unknown function (DUF5925)
MTESLGARFRLVHGLQEADPVSALFMARVFDEDLRQLRDEHWATSERSLAALGEPLMRSAGAGNETKVLERDGALMLISLHGGFVHAQAAAIKEETAASAIARLRELLPAPEPVATQEVPVVFWTYSPQGPMPSVRKIAVPEWHEIRENYTQSTKASLERIMSDFRPAHGGQLVLWHGEVGTGKTFALRALAWEWREWCQIHYVVDPDTFFGEHADYLMTVLMQSGGMGEHVGMLMSVHGVGMGRGWTSYGPHLFDVHEDLIDDEGEEDIPDEAALALGRRSAPHWRLLVLEDTGELLRPDAKSIIGQGLSRFVNLVDGLIGQGLRVLVLVTTNERIETLHPAVARPGRCAANIEFDPFSEEEAIAWLDRRGAGVRAEAPRILASLYAQLEGHDPAEPPRQAKFDE